MVCIETEQNQSNLTTFCRALDSLHQALVIHAVYHYVVTNFGKPDQMAQIVWYVSLSSPFRYRVLIYPVKVY